MTFQVALSGINAASKDLNVVGNNIANASTSGFKASRAEFSDVFSAGNSANTVSTGVQVSSIKQDFAQGTVSFTSNNLDLAISGEGFFTLSDNGVQTYSRAGSFNLDKEGHIVNPASHRLQGFLADETGNVTSTRGDLVVSKGNIEPRSTQTAAFQVNLNAQESAPASAWVGSPTFGSPVPATNTYNSSSSTTIYDSLGNSHVLTSYFVKNAANNQWDVRVQIDNVDVDSAPAGAPFTQMFSNGGVRDDGASEAINVSWTPLDGNGNPNGANTQTLNIDLSKITQFGSPFSVQDITQDGFTTGRLDSVDIDATGTIFGRYTNGQSKAMGQLTLANFSNPNGLQPRGDNIWEETLTSGQPLVGEPGSSSLGLVQSGAIEESNVDLTGELVKMILAQRNFQANAQVIQVADTVTQSVINLR